MIGLLVSPAPHRSCGVSLVQASKSQRQRQQRVQAQRTCAWRIGPCRGEHRRCHLVL